MDNSKIKKLCFSGVFLALALVLPFITGQIPQIGAALAPMHFPVLLCGFLCGAPWGAAVGFIAPFLRMFLFGMPPFIKAIGMAFELATYGFASGFLYKRFAKKKAGVYITLITAMILGRLVWGLVRYILAGLQNTEFGLSAFWAGAVSSAIPGIILQIILIPLLVKLLEKYKKGEIS